MASRAQRGLAPRRQPTSGGACSSPRRAWCDRGAGARRRSAVPLRDARRAAGPAPARVARVVVSPADPRRAPRRADGRRRPEPRRAPAAAAAAQPDTFPLASPRAGDHDLGQLASLPAAGRLHRPSSSARRASNGSPSRSTRSRDSVAAFARRGVFVSDLYTLQASSLPRLRAPARFPRRRGMSRPHRFDLRFARARREPRLRPRRAPRAARDADGQRRRRHRPPALPRHRLRGRVPASERADGAVYAAVLVPEALGAVLSRHSRVWVDQRVPTSLEDVLRHAGPRRGRLRAPGWAAASPRASNTSASTARATSTSSRAGWTRPASTTSSSRARTIEARPRQRQGARTPPPIRALLRDGSLRAPNVEGPRAFRCRAVSQPDRYKVTGLQPADADAPHRRRARPRAAAISGHAVVRHAEGDAGCRSTRRAAQVDAQAATREPRAAAKRGPRTGSSRVRFDLEDHPAATSTRPASVTEAEHRGTMAQRPHRQELPVRLRGIAADTQFPRRRARRCPTRRAWRRRWSTARPTGLRADRRARALPRALPFRQDVPPAGRRRARPPQPHAGEPEGWHLPLRKGTEVVVAFSAATPTAR